MQYIMRHRATLFAIVHVEQQFRVLGYLERRAQINVIIIHFIHKKWWPRALFPQPEPNSIPSICTDRIPRSRNCCWLFWARRRRRSAASRGMLKVTRTLFHGSTRWGLSLSGPAQTNKQVKGEKHRQGEGAGLVIVSSGMCGYHTERCYVELGHENIT